MPTIKQYGAQKTTTQIASQAQARNAPAAAFGGAIAKGIGDIGVEYERVQDDISSTEARDALNKFQKSEMDLLSNPETGFYGKNGINAYNGAQPTMKSLEKLKKELGGNLSDTARMKFDTAAAERISAANMNVNRHAAKGYQTWKISGFDDEIANNLEEAAVNFTDPKAFSASMTKGSQAAAQRASLAGVDSKEAVETFRGEFVKNAVLSAIDQGSTTAEKVMTDNIKYLQGEGATERLLKGKIAEKKKAEQVAYETTFALNKAKVLNDTYGDDRESMMAEVETISDLKLREKTMKQATVEFNRRKTAASEARGETFEEAQVAVNDPLGIDGWVASNPDKWLSLKEKERQQLRSGKFVISDMNTYIDLTLLPIDDLAQVDPNDYTTVLAKAELSKLTASVKAARNGDTGVGRTRATTVNSYLENVVGKKKSAWSDDDRKTSNAFQRFLAVEEKALRDEKGKPLTDIEFDELLNRTTSKYIIEGKMNWNEEDKFLDEEVTFESFEDDNASKYSEWLRARGLEVNMKNLGLAKRKNVLGLQ